MDLSNKQLLALNFVAGFLIVGLTAAVLWPRLRDVLLFVMIFGAVFVRKWMDISFGGIWWYRGTSRGFEFSGIDVAAWALLGATLLARRYREHRVYFPAGVGLWILYFLYCWGSVAHADPQIYGWWELAKNFRALLILIVAALFIRTRREVLVMVVAFACSVWFLGLNAIEQRVVKHVLRPPATMDHENSLSMYLCSVTPLLVAAAMANWHILFRWFCGLTCLLAVGTEMMTLSRAGVPIMFFVVGCTALFCASWRITRRKLVLITACAAVAGTMLTLSLDSLKRRWTETSLNDEFTGEVYESRGFYWRIAMAIAEDRPYGVGLNNWSYHVSKTYSARLGIPYNDYDEVKTELSKDDTEHAPNFAPPAHSMTCLTYAELGLAGLVLLLLVWLRWFQMGASFLRDRLNPDPMHRLGIGLLFCAVGTFLHGITEWTYRQTQVLFTVHILMGALASLYYLKKQRRRAEKRAAELGESDDLEGELIETDPLPAAPVRRGA